MILVTGGTGFVGTKVVHALRARDLPVRALARRPGDEHAHRLGTLGCEIVPGDMTDADSLGRAVEGVETVVHLVSIRQGTPEQFERIMTRGTGALVAAAEAAGARRFVLMSALGVDEETKDLVPYYRAKWEMEEIVRAAGLEHVILRPSFVFGRDGGILATFRKLARLMPITPIAGPGKQRIQPIWIDDVAETYALAVDLEAAANRTFELGGPDVVTWDEFWVRLKRALGVRRASVHVPMTLMRMNALVAERLPGDVPLTRDLLKMLAGPDNVVSNDDARAVFGLQLVTLDEQLRRAAA